MIEFCCNDCGFMLRFYPPKLKLQHLYYKCPICCNNIESIIKLKMPIGYFEPIIKKDVKG